MCIHAYGYGHPYLLACDNRRAHTHHVYMDMHIHIGIMHIDMDVHMRMCITHSNMSKDMHMHCIYPFAFICVHNLNIESTY